MTRDEAVAYLKHLLFEESASPTTALASDPNFLTTLNAANKTIWNIAAEENHRHLTMVSQPYSLAGDSRVPLSVFTGGADNVYLITDVQVKEGPQWFALDQLAQFDAAAVEESSTGYAGDRVEYVAFYVEGDDLCLYPPVDGMATIRLKYVPKAADLSTPTTQLLNGKLAEFHQAVVYDAAIELATKDDARVTGWMARRADSIESLKRYLRGRVRGFPKAIRIVDE